VLDNGSLYWFAWMNSSFLSLMPSGPGNTYDVHYFYVPTQTAMILKMTLPQMLTDPYMQAMGSVCSHSCSQQPLWVVWSA
jgi:hypothetical protein